MDMYVDSQLIRNERLKRAWSQEHLAHVSGLGLRTVQRMENGGNASLETAKALAAVLELPVEALFVEAPLQTVAVVAPPPPRFSLFKPLRTFVAGCLATLIATGSFIGMQGAIAEQVLLDFALKCKYQLLSEPRMTVRNATPAMIRVGNDDGSLLELKVTPTIE